MTKLTIAHAFSTGNFEPCFDYIKENIIWHTPGAQTLQGKIAIEAFCKQVTSYFNCVTTNFNTLHCIEKDNYIVVSGTATFTKNEQLINFISSCDIYQFDDEKKITNITSYCISEKQES